MTDSQIDKNVSLTTEKKRAHMSRTQTQGKQLRVAATAAARTDAERQRKRQAILTETKAFSLAIGVFQLIVLLIFALWFEYARDAKPEIALYGYFRDVNIMIFFGFGFLMTFLRRNGYSAIGYTFVTSALVIEWSMILQTVVEEIVQKHGISKRHEIGINHALNGLFCAGAVMISYGGILGKVTPSAMFILGVIEPVFYWLNVYIGQFKLKAVDVGGGIFIHLFGGYFGMTLTWWLTSPASQGHPDNSSCYSSDLFSLAGTLFLWIMWPSFNAAVALGEDAQMRAILNTFLSLIGATVATFVVTRLLHRGKIDVVHVQNATLAGGVVMGVVADQDIHIATALGMGIIAGIISTLGFKYLTPLLNNKLNLQDICGIHNLHAMPGLLGAILWIFTTWILHAKKGVYFPNGKKQPSRQLAAILVTLGLALVGGVVVGLLIRLSRHIYKIYPEDFFNDRVFWMLPSDYDNIERPNEDGTELGEITRAGYHEDEV